MWLFGALVLSVALVWLVAGVALTAAQGWKWNRTLYYNIVTLPWAAADLVCRPAWMPCGPVGAPYPGDPLGLWRAEVGRLALRDFKAGRRDLLSFGLTGGSLAGIDGRDRGAAGWACVPGPYDRRYPVQDGLCISVLNTTRVDCTKGRESRTLNVPIADCGCVVLYEGKVYNQAKLQLLIAEASNSSPRRPSAPGPNSKAK